MKILYVLLYILILLANALLLVVFTWLFFPYKLAEVEEPLTVLNKDNLHKGDNIVLVINYEKYRNVHTHTIRTIQCEDGNLVTLTPTETNLPAGQNTVITNKTVVPDKTSIGVPCKLVLAVSYQANPLREITRSYKSESFIVKE